MTGGAGFIGSHLVDGLLAADARVRVLDDLSTGRRDHLAAAVAAAPERLAVTLGDVRDAGVCAAALQGAGYLFHLAAVASVPGSFADSAGMFDVNLGGSARIFAAARAAGVERLVYASSSSVYGTATDVPSREGAEGLPLSPYAASKRMLEDLAAVEAHCFGRQVMGLRFFNVYGARQDPASDYAAVVPAFAAAWRAGRAPIIYGDGEQTRDFVHVDDAVAALLRAAVTPAVPSGKALNVGGGSSVSINELARVIRQLLGGDSLPLPRYEEARPGEVRHSRADLTAVESVLGYRPSVPLVVGLARTLVV